MQRIILDPALRSKLQDVIQPVELCDETGRVLGQFVPALNPSEYVLEPQISEEEIQRRLASNEPRYTTAEVLAYLEKL